MYEGFRAEQIHGDNGHGGYQCPGDERCAGDVGSMGEQCPGDERWVYLGRTVYWGRAVY